jgi:hypothetical protein
MNTHTDSTTTAKRSQLLKVTDVAQLLNVKPRTIYEMVAQDRIPYRKRAPVAAPRERIMIMSVHKRGTKWHYAFCIRGVRYRGAIPEASTKFDAEKAETKIRQDVYEGRYGRLTGNKDFGKFVEEVYKPWAMENKRSFKSNDKYKLSIICESKCFKGKTFAQISPLLIGKVQEGAT